VVVGLMAAVPLFHMEFFSDAKYINEFSTYPWALGGGLYILGAVLYMLKIPERFKPGRFDIWVSNNANNNS
jgi:adiponectin receptor